MVNLKKNLSAATLVAAYAMLSSTVVLANSGGQCDSSGNYVGSNNPSGSTVIIDGECTMNVYGGDLNSSGSVTNNSVTVVDGGKVTNGVYGGDSSAGAAVVSNTVTITGGSVGSNVVGGNARGETVTVTVSGNTVNISGGTVCSSSYYVCGGMNNTSNGNATGNSVTISGGTVNGDVYGGKTGTGAATNNLVILAGTPTINGGVYGGYTNNSGTGDVRTGNTLEVRTSGLSVKKLANFEIYKFFLPATISSGETVLTVTDTSSTLDLKNCKISVSANGAQLQDGDKITLIKSNSTASIECTSFTTENCTGSKGLMEYDLVLGTDGNALVATVANSHVKPQAKALSEGWLGGTVLALQAADLAADKGMNAAVLAGSQGGTAAFGAVSAGSLRYDTGSHVDMQSFSIVAGMAKGFDGAVGHFSFGAFLEYGDGNYDTYNSFSNAAAVDGDGSSSYAGVGLLAHMDFSENANGHFRVEGSLRAGRLTTDFDSSDLCDANGNAVEYDTGASYTSFHVGLGYTFKMAETSELDAYCKYFYTHVSGAETELSTGDPLEFSGVNSSRFRLGARYTCRYNDFLRAYVGASWEYEFDGESDASVYGNAIEGSPDLSGSTGVGEVGCAIDLSSAMVLDLGVQGYLGKREGATVSVTFTYKL